MKNIKTDSTIWLDFLSFILCPAFIIYSSLRLKESIFSQNIILMLLFFVSIIISAITFYKVFKKEKLGYTLIQIFSILCYLITLIDIIFKYKLFNIIFIIIMIIVSIILLGFNYLYILKRKDIFRKHNLAHIKKCPGCNRIIPIHMTSCGKCDYKED